MKTRNNTLTALQGALAVLLAGSAGAFAQAIGPSAGINYDVPNYANSPLLTKFVDGLPGLGPTAANNLGQYVPVAAPDQAAFPGSDYFEIAVVDYTEKMHSELPPTRLRGYVQIYPPGSAHPATAPQLFYPDGTTPILHQSKPVFAYDKPHYLGPLIIAVKDVPTRIKFYNLLQTGDAGNLFIPVDTTIMGAGEGGWALTLDGTGAWTQQFKAGTYPQNRATLHLHGGNTPWISDGTPHQWTIPETPHGSPNFFNKGVSSQDVPGMPTGEGEMTFYYPNQQSGRLMFYHDHSYGITRLNVYAGEAAGYLLVDPAERALTDGSTPGIPAMADLPLVIEDKTFVWGQHSPVGTLAATTVPASPNPQAGAVQVPPAGAIASVTVSDPTVYDVAPTVIIADADGTGRGATATTDWTPSSKTVTAITVVNPGSGYGHPVVTMGTGTWATDPTWADVVKDSKPGDLWFPHVYVPTQDDPSHSALDNPFGRWDYGPYMGSLGVPGNGNLPATTSVVPESFMDVMTVNGTAYPYVTVEAKPYRLRILDACNDRFVSLSFCIADPKAPTEVQYVKDSNGKPVKNLDGTPILDTTTEGPGFIQFGTEGGLLPNPVPVSYNPIGYDSDNGNVTSHALLLAPAERVDAVVDFTPYAGKTLILYNDSPAPFPGGDSRYDYFTGNSDQRSSGGTDVTQPGRAPNTRTILQVKVLPATGTVPPAPPGGVNQAILAGLQAATALPSAFAASQEKPIVPDSTPLVQLADTTLTFTPSEPIINPAATMDNANGTVTLPMLRKSINELFDPEGRLNSILGTESATSTPNSAVPLAYIDPSTENIADGETQIWRITHNGVDTHAIHFHLVNVQIVNRIKWVSTLPDSTTGPVSTPPELNERGWKDTVRMNPFEDIVVVVRAKTQVLPFSLGESIRPRSVLSDLGTNLGFTQVDPSSGVPATIDNIKESFGWEYVWHCHILGHEESDMMRPMVMTVVGNTYVDTDTPTVVANVTGTKNASSWYTSLPTVAITATDLKGVAIVNYSVNNAPAVSKNFASKPTTATVSPPITADGKYAIAFSTADAAGHAASGSTAFNVDSTAPTLAEASVPGANKLGWNTANVNGITLTANDNVSGLKTLTYSVTVQGRPGATAGNVNAATLLAAGNPTTYKTGTIQLPGNGGNGLTANGTYTVNVAYTVGDVAGNTTASPPPLSLTVKIDKNAPVVSTFTKKANYTGTGANKRAMSVDITSPITVSDVGSGFAPSGSLTSGTGTVVFTSGAVRITQPLPSGTPTAGTALTFNFSTTPIKVGQTYTLTATFTDLAGNVGTRSYQGQF